MRITLELPDWINRALTQELELQGEQIKSHLEMVISQVVKNQLVERWKAELTRDAGRELEARAEAVFGKKPGSVTDGKKFPSKDGGTGKAGAVAK